MVKHKTIISSWYREGTISIPTARLQRVIEKGDVIYGTSGCNFSSQYTGYRVTHVAWWGVWAVPTDEMLKYHNNKPRNIKRHYKFKWQNITGINFVA